MIPCRTTALVRQLGGRLLDHTLPLIDSVVTIHLQQCMRLELKKN
jgi:hypothetical protein